MPTALSCVRDADQAVFPIAKHTLDAETAQVARMPALTTRGAFLAQATPGRLQDYKTHACPALWATLPFHLTTDASP